MEVNAHLWGCRPEDLLTSNDALCYGYPSARAAAASEKKAAGDSPKKKGKKAQVNGWLHTDQAWRRRGLWCVQGQVALTPQSRALGCLMVRRGSHLAWDDFCARAPRFQTTASKAKSSDWNPLTDAELDEFFPRDRFPEVYIEAPAGSLVLWASNTLHQGNVPERARAVVDAGDGKDAAAAPEAAEPRQVVYVCQVPRDRVPTATIDPKTGHPTPLTADQRSSQLAQLRKERAKKMMHFLARRQTKHAPDTPRLFGTMPRTYGDKKVVDGAKAFLKAVEDAKLGAAPIVQRTPAATTETTVGEPEDPDATESDDEEEGAESGPKRRKATPTVWPEDLPAPLRAALIAAEAASRGKGAPPCPSDDLLPASLADLDAETKARLWRLNGFD